MLERFTQAAQTAITLAEEEARALGNREVGVEHLLLGLLREETGLAGRLLEELGMTLEGARAEVARSVPPDEGPVPDRLEFTAGTKRALEHALREALAHADSVIGPEHILLGLLEVGNRVALRILEASGGEPEALRKELLDWLRKAPPASPSAPGGIPSLVPPATRWEYQVLADQLDDPAAAALNRLGAEGWELVHVAGQTPPFRLVLRRRAR